MGAIFWFVIFAALVVIPFWKILPKNGFPAPLALLAILPVGVVILLWMIAFKDKFR